MQQKFSRAWRARGEKFYSAEEAWFWACRSMMARLSGSRSNCTSAARPCEPDDILLSVERLLTTGRLDQSHGHVLAVWGRRQMAPSAWQSNDPDRRLWIDAMVTIRAALHAKGLLADAPKIGK